jgi:hypothetical protein
VPDSKDAGTVREEFTNDDESISEVAVDVSDEDEVDRQGDAAAEFINECETDSDEADNDGTGFIEGKGLDFASAGFKARAAAAEAELVRNAVEVEVSFEESFS